MVGTRLSHYLVEEEIGQGGMGVIYKAQDTRLFRSVAIKILPPHLVSNEKNRQRFVQEARAASALNHPNICTVHDIGEANGVHFIVMELVEGKTLRQILEERGRLPEEEVIEIGVKICEALAAAHDRGIIHRDIKPDNIMITEQGLVKVMDFGLAKLTSDAMPPMPATGVARSTERLVNIRTTFSSFQGTPSYMSPEQVRKEAVDLRTDIFSLGVVLYELSVGRLPFRGQTNLDIMKSTLSEAPNWKVDEKSAITRQLCDAIDTALKKDPDERFKDAQSFAAELRPTQRIDTGVHSKKLVASLVAFAFLVLSVGVWFVKNWTSESNDPNRRPFANASTFPFTNWSRLENEPAFSPDGQRIAFTSDRAGNSDIWIREIATDRVWNLTKDSLFRDMYPRWSPSGAQIAFRSERDGGGIFVMDFSTNSTHKVFSDGRSAAWSPDGRKIAVISYITARELYIVHANGENADLVFEWEHRGEMGNVSWSPDGAWLAFNVGGQQAWNIYIKSALGEGSFSLTEDTFFDKGPVWDRQANGIYFRSDRGGVHDIWYKRLNLRTMRPVGEAIPITFGAEVEAFDVAQDGRRIAYSKVNVKNNVFAVDLKEYKNSLPRQVTNWDRITVDPSLSPDGKRIAMASNNQGKLSLWVCDRDGNNPTMIYEPEESCESPTWSPDGKKILFVDGDAEMILKIMDFPTGKTQTIYSDAAGALKPAWSPDGKWIVYNGPGGIHMMNTRNGERKFLIKNGISGKFSPDGKTIAFRGRHENTTSIWTIPFDGGTLKQLSLDTEMSGLGLCWSPDGQYIYYAPMHNGVRNIWRVSTDGKFKEQITFFDSSTNHVRRSTDLSTDGKELFFANYERIGDIWFIEAR